MGRNQPTRPVMAESLTATIVDEVSDREGVDPTALPPLHDVIDPDALTAVFAPTSSGSSRTDGRVEFTYCGYQVVAHSDGRVQIEGDEAE